MDHLDKEKIKKLLGEARASRGYTQLQMAAALGCDRSYVSNMERGSVTVSKKMLCKIREAASGPKDPVAALNRISRELQTVIGDLKSHLQQTNQKDQNENTRNPRPSPKS